MAILLAAVMAASAAFSPLLHASSWLGVQPSAQNLKVQGITWPVAVDNDFALWRAYGIEYWPTQLIFDRHGHLRKTIVGEGQDTVVAATVRELLSER